jgi:hypothetical protein
MKNVMRNIAIVAGLGFVAMSSHAGVVFHPVERAAVVAASPNPVAAAAVTAHRRNERVAAADALSCNDGHCVQHGTVNR